MFIGAKDDGNDGDNWTTGAIRHAKLQSNRHQQTNTQFFTGRMSFLSPNQQCCSVLTVLTQFGSAVGCYDVQRVTVRQSDNVDLSVCLQVEYINRVL